VREATSTPLRGESGPKENYIEENLRFSSRSPRFSSKNADIYNFLREKGGSKSATCVPIVPLTGGDKTITSASLTGPTQPVREATPSRGPPVGGREGGQDP